jgi:hypothetical protein
MLIWIMLKVAKTGRTFCVSQGCQLQAIFLTKLKKKIAILEGCAHGCAN